MLETIDLSAHLEKGAFDPRKLALHTELRRAQLKAWKNKLGVMIVLEGWSYSGRTTVARFISQPMDPRGLKVQMVYPPTREEARYPFHRRYWSLLPARGDLALFVRSWYYHLLDGQMRAKGSILGQVEVIDEIREFEKMLAEDGYLILKFWLHIDKKTQRKRRKQYSKGRAYLERFVPDDPKQHKRRKRYTEAIETMLAGTDTDHGRWHLIPATDEDFSRLAVASTIVRRIDEEVARRTSRVAEKKPVSAPAPPAPDLLSQSQSVLSALDMTQKLEDEVYSERLRQAQLRLGDLVYDCVDQRRAVVLVFEGSDAAGKGGAIRRLTAELDPRYYVVHPIAAPKPEEKDRHYLWRFWQRLPPAGHWAVFDRSWYGRVLVERVEGFAREEEWQRAYDEIRHFEHALIEHGAILLKFWLQVTPDEQLRRFQERQQVEYKNYKITEEDWRNREKGPAYEQAVEEMVQRTSLPLAPWVVVPANDKNYARIMVLETIEQHIKEGLARKQSRLRRSF
jgi:polyphosphate:AMP phosphotransferase